MTHMIYAKDNNGKDVQVETDCTIEFEGKEFTSGGAVITDNFILGYKVKITSKWRINSWQSSHMYQVRVFCNGRYYTGRTMGGNMIVRLRVCKP